MSCLPLIILLSEWFKLDNHLLCYLISAIRKP